MNEKEENQINEVASDEKVPVGSENVGKPSKILYGWIGLSVLLLVALLFVLWNGKVDGQMNETVGEVNGVSITKAELYDEMIQQLGDTPSQILDTMITTKLISMEAEKENVKVSDADIDKELADIKKSYPSEEQFEADLEQSYMTLDDLKRQIMIQLQLRKIFEPKISVKDEDLKAYFEENKESFGTPEQVQASHILLNEKKEAESVLQQLKDGADFAELAKQFSQDPGSKDNGGELPLFGRGEMYEEFENAAFELGKGEMSGIVESPGGFHIIKVTDKIAAQTPAFEEKQEEVKKAYFDEQLQAQLPDWLEKIRKEAEIKNSLS